ncbi:MAG: AbrB/MazE/SpoVT family DNA-binding domain-containing protein [Planctomycetes bacterium]|nr:AbrB/MazE/SpoVT family DNA-binding domain-containing protein [Planctomycetota bacterium]MBM4085935.1 AbrB/MazE/SpoVT family DNA-binding domain-containing protein [Planctomycetota bacterium]
MAETLELKVDEEGRISLPKASRERLGLSPGMTLVVEQGDDDALRLRVQRGRPRLVRKGTALVVAATRQSPEMADVVQRHREERLGELAGRTSP